VEAVVAVGNDVDVPEVAEVVGPLEGGAADGLLEHPPRTVAHTSAVTITTHRARRPVPGSVKS
jgi:hypothetical protein